MLNTYFQNNKRTNADTFGSKKLKLKKGKKLVVWYGIVSYGYQEYLIPEIFLIVKVDQNLFMGGFENISMEKSTSISMVSHGIF